MQDYYFTELERRLANLVKVGRVYALDLDSAVPRVKVKMGQLITAWLPFVSSRAGSDRTWWPVQIDEKVLVISPSGEMAQGLVIGAFYQQSVSPPSRDADSIELHCSDGAVFSYNKQSHALYIDLPSEGKVTVNAPQGITLQGDVRIEGNVSASGDISDHTRAMKDDRVIFNQHTHAGVRSGPSQTPPPTQQQ